MKKLGLLLVFAASFALTQKATTASQPIQLPPKPTCVVILLNGSCAELWRQYNTAVLQLYVARQKASASAPLQQQISEQQDQIKNLQEQMKAYSTAAVQANAETHTEGMQEGAGLGAGGVLLLIALLFGIRKLTQGFTVTKKNAVRPTSA
jgi:uncharacterized protein GlcG (DUF336 family)